MMLFVFCELHCVSCGCVNSDTHQATEYNSIQSVAYWRNFKTWVKISIIKKDVTAPHFTWWGEFIIKLCLIRSLSDEYIYAVIQFYCWVSLLVQLGLWLSFLWDIVGTSLNHFWRLGLGFWCSILVWISCPSSSISRHSCWGLLPVYFEDSSLLCCVRSTSF